jgi:simple sugar transport system ATP-binding protein
VTQTELVLQSIREAKARGLGVVFITHNVRHATDVGDCFTVLNQGRLIASRTQDQTSLEELQGLMSGRDGSLA